MNECIRPIADIHSHIMPGMDDGSTSIDMSMKMIDMEYEQGTRILYLTSHHDAAMADPLRYGQMYYYLFNKCCDRYPDMHLLTGSEIYCDKFDTSIIRQLRGNPYLKMSNYNGQTNKILVEFPLEHFSFNKMYNILNDFLNCGYIPIIAHTERYFNFLYDIEMIEELKRLGCFIQINAYSIINEGNEKIKKLANKILKYQYADFIGSDAHRTDHRPPMLIDGVNEIYNKYNINDYAKAVTYKNAIKNLFN